MSKFDKAINDRIKDTQELIEGLKLDEFRKKQIKIIWLDFISLMEHLTQKHFRRYNILNLTTIISGILVPVTINLIPSQYYATLSGTILGVMSSVSAAINQSYRVNDRWRHFRLISENLKIEGEKFFALSDNYHSFTTHEEEAFKLFMKNVEDIKQNQIDVYFKSVIKSIDKENEK